jgi:NitT/TauT family transport system substrate-binding protein
MTAIPALIRRFILGALTAAATMHVAPPAGAQTAIKFSFDWKFEGTQATFLVAFDKGYFKAEGLDVTFDSGVSSVESINRLAAGTYDMAFGDINMLVKFRDQYPQTPIKTVFMIYNNPPYAIIARKSRGVTAPKDLEGKKLGAPTADSAYAQWPIFARANNIDQSKVTVMNIGFPVREPMLVSGYVDAVTGLSFSSYINVKYAGVPHDDIVVLLMTDFGVHLYGNGIMVSSKFAAEKPEAVRSFLRAYLKGLKDTVKDPEAAIDSVLKRNDVAQKHLELERLQLALRDNVLTPEVQANGFGAVDNARLEKAIEQISLTYSFRSGRPRAQDIFDSSFLPADTERRAN